MDSVTNEEVHGRAEIEMELGSKVNRRVEMVGHVERMDEYCIARKVSMVEVSGKRVCGRLQLGWVYSVKVALGSSMMAVNYV